MDFYAVIIVLCKLFFLLVLGFFLNKKHILDSHSNKAISSLVINATNPALILGSLASIGDVSQGDVLRLVAFGLIFYALLPVIAFLFVRIFRIDLRKRSTAMLLVIFSNTGFMAIPVLQTLYGDVSVFYCNILNLPFNFLIYTLGIYLLRKNPADEGSESGDDKKSPISWKVFITPGIIASIIALVLFFLRLRLPAPVSETFMFLGNVTPPLTMLLLGSILAEYPLKSVFADGKLDLMLTAKQLLLPLPALFLAKLLFTDPVIIGIAALTFAMPCGTMCAMLSKEHHGDTLTASAGVVFSTVLSLITIPIIYLVLGPLF